MLLGLTQQTKRSVIKGMNSRVLWLKLELFPLIFNVKAVYFQMDIVEMAYNQ